MIWPTKWRSSLADRPAHFVITLAGIWAASSADAASFDCERAKAPMEVAICSDPKASTSDVAMAKSYAAALAKLSPPGQAAMRESQRAFLRYAETLCQPGKRPLDAENTLFTMSFSDQQTPSNARMVADCISKAFSERAARLDDAVEMAAGKTFFETTQYKVRAVQRIDHMPDKEYVHHETVSRIASLVQIDRPASPSDIAWNAAMQDWLADMIWEAEGDTEGPRPAEDVSFPTSMTDVEAAISISSASADVIAATGGVSTYWKGAAHPNWSGAHQIWSLGMGRMLTSADIFSPAKPWATDLAPVVQARLVGIEGSTPADFGKIDSIDQISFWDIGPEGILLVYSPYVLGGYLSSATALLPWPLLKPYLRKDMPFNPAALEVPVPKR